MEAPLIASILNYAVTYGIPAARKIVELIRKPDPTLEDWNRAFDAATKNAEIFLRETDDLEAKPAGQA